MEFILNPVVITVLALVISAILVIGFLLNRYRKCPSDQVLVVFGSFSGSHEEVVKNEKTGKETKVTITKPAKTINGGGTFVWPIVQDWAKMSLKPFQLKTKFTGKDKDNIDVELDVTLTTAIGREKELMEAAATRILHMNITEQKDLLSDILDGELRGIVANMGVLELKDNRDEFIKRAKEQLEPEMNKYGFSLMNLTASDVKDKADILVSLSQKAAQKATQQAQIDIETEKKRGETEVAIVQRDKDILLAQTNLERDTKVSETEKNRATQVADIDKEKAKALEQTKTDKEIAIREIQKNNILKKTEIAKDEAAQAAALLTEKETAIANANADKEANLKKAEADAEIRKAQFEANQTVETAKASAEAEVQANTVQYEADATVAARKNESLAKQTEAEALKATRIAQANAERDAATAKAEQERDAKKAEFNADKDKRTYIANKNANITKQQAIAEIAKAEGDAEVAKQDAIRKGSEAKVIAEQAVAKRAQEMQLEVNEAKALATEAELNASTIVPAEMQKKKATIQAQQEKEVAALDAEANAIVAETEAKGEAAAVIAKGTAEADMIRLRGNAEAEAIKAKAMAEVEAEVLKAQGLEAAKASSFAKMVEVAGGVDGAIAFARLEYDAKVQIANSENYSKSLNGMFNERAQITLGGSSSAVAEYGSSLLGLIPAIQNVAKVGKEVVGQVKAIANTPAKDFEETK